MLSRSAVSDSVTLWTVARQAPLALGILQASILEWVAMPSSRPRSPALQMDSLPSQLQIGTCQGHWPSTLQRLNPVLL